jgi:hypothetical protein
VQLASRFAGLGGCADKLLRVLRDAFRRGDPVNPALFHELVAVATVRLVLHAGALDSDAIVDLLRGAAVGGCAGGDGSAHGQPQSSIADCEGTAAQLALTRVLELVCEACRLDPAGTGSRVMAALVGDAGEAGHLAGGA